MAVLIEGFSVVIRNATVAEKYPGGVDAFRADSPNATFCTDEHLSRVGFMVPHDADVFVAQLAALGFTPYRKDAAEDVAVVSQVEGPLKPCRWLEFGEYRGARIAWLAGKDPGDLHATPGWDPDRKLKFLSTEEARERLEFVRSEENIDVYRDRTTGEELYIGRTAPATDADRAEHDDLHRRACDLVQGLILTHGQGPGELDPESRKRLDDSIPMFTEVVRINPQNWAAMWLAGKVHQRLGDHEASLDWFAMAHRVNPDHEDVAREAAIAAMEAGRPEEAIPYCERAIQSNPDEPGLRCNLALALLFSGRPRDAGAVAADAFRRDPSDPITSQIVGIIEEVLNGTRPCPKHVRDLQPDRGEESP